MSKRLCLGWSNPDGETPTPYFGFIDELE